MTNIILGIALGSPVLSGNSIPAGFALITYNSSPNITYNGSPWKYQGRPIYVKVS